MGFLLGLFLLILVFIYKFCFSQVFLLINSEWVNSIVKDKEQLKAISSEMPV